MNSCPPITLFENGQELCQVIRVEGLPSGQCAWFGLSSASNRRRFYALMTSQKPDLSPSTVHYLSGVGENLPILIRHITKVEGGYLLNVEITVTSLRERGLANNFSVRLAA